MGCRLTIDEMSCLITWDNDEAGWLGWNTKGSVADYDYSDYILDLSLNPL